MSEDANERYECLRCETSMAPEDLRARVVLATFHEPAYTEYVCPWCGGEVLSAADRYQLEQIIDHNTPELPGDRS